MKWILLVALTLATQGVSAEIYKWVDKDGKVHFGDQPPDADAKAAQSVEVHPNVVGHSGSGASPSSPAYVIHGPATGIRTIRKPASTSTAGTASAATAPTDNSCAAQMARYQASVACFNKCFDAGKGRIGPAGTELTGLLPDQKSALLHHYRNLRGKNAGACTGCQDVPQPNCGQLPPLQNVPIKRVRIRGVR